MVKTTEIQINTLLFIHSFIHSWRLNSNFSCNSYSKHIITSEFLPRVFVQYSFSSYLRLFVEICAENGVTDFKMMKNDYELY